MRAPIKPLPSQEALLRLLSYDADSGALTWRRQEGSALTVRGFNNKCGGKVAGTVSQKSKYLVVGIRLEPLTPQVCYLAHRLIWKMMTGDDPDDQIDHRDGDRQNNRWSNLRPADNVKNLFNSKLRVDNTSGFKGVHLRTNGKKYRKWRAIVTANGRHFRLGDFDTPEEAAAARKRAAETLHGEFARYQ